MFRSTRVATLLVSSILFAACSFNPLSPRNQQAATNALIEQGNATENPAQGAQLSAPADFDLFQEGEGRMSLQGRGDRSLRAVSLSGQDARAELAFEGTDGSLVRLSGNLVSYTPTVMIIDFTQSGDAEASGSVRVKYHATAVDSLTGNGVLDGQNFSIEFRQNLVQVPTPPALTTTALPQSVALSNSASNSASNSKPSASSAPIPLAPIQPSAASPPAASIELPADRLIRPDINLSQQGAGIFSVAGQANKTLSSASVMGRENGRVDLVLHFANAEQVRFLGSVEQKNADAIVVRLLNAENTAATGTVTIEYGADQTIHTLLGDGILEAQPFSVQFSQ